MYLIQVLFGCFIVLVLSILPFPFFLSIFMPSWVVLYIIWFNFSKDKSLLFIPSLIWFMGIMLDMLQQTVLGLHVLALFLMQLFIGKYRLKFKMFPLPQQLLVVWLATIVYLLTLMLFQVHTNWSWDIGRAFCITIVTAFIWPWIDMMLKPKLVVKNKLI